MKIAVETKDGGKTIAGPFVRSVGFLVYDIDDWEIKNCHYCNEKTLDSLFESKDIAEWDAIISRGLPTHIKQYFESMGKEVMITFSSSPNNAIQAYLANHMRSKMIH